MLNIFLRRAMGHNVRILTNSASTAGAFYPRRATDGVEDAVTEKAKRRWLEEAFEDTDWVRENTSGWSSFQVRLRRGR